MVRLKKFSSHSNKMVSYQVGLQVNGENEEVGEISFNTIGNLKILLVEFAHRCPIILYLKDISLLNQSSNDILKLKYNLLEGVELYNIRFGTLQDKENFIQTTFADRMLDSGQSDSSSSNSTPSPPQ